MGKLILLLDESATVDQLVKLAFEGEGIEVVSANTVPAAREFLKQRTPDLILADPLLPEGDAPAFIRSIRTGPEQSQISVIWLSAASSSPSNRPVAGSGGDAVLTKPFESMTLVVSTVKEILERRLLIPEPAKTGSVPAALLDESADDDLILELDDSTGWPKANPASHLSDLLASLPAGFVEEVADRVANLLLARISEQVNNDPVVEPVTTVLEMMTKKPVVIESKTSADIDEAVENPDH